MVTGLIFCEKDFFCFVGTPEDPGGTGGFFWKGCGRGNGSDFRFNVISNQKVKRRK